jgi:hypothetical protein
MRWPRPEFDKADKCDSSLRSRCSGCGAEIVAQGEFCNDGGTLLDVQPELPFLTRDVLKELTMFTIADNLVRLVMRQSAAQELPIDNQTPASTASAVDPARAPKLTSCQSAKSHKLLKSV